MYISYKDYCIHSCFICFRMKLILVDMYMLFILRIVKCMYPVNNYGSFFCFFVHSHNIKKAMFLFYVTNEVDLRSVSQIQLVITYTQLCNIIRFIKSEYFFTICSFFSLHYVYVTTLITMNITCCNNQQLLLRKSYTCNVLGLYNYIHIEITNLQ